MDAIELEYDPLLSFGRHLAAIRRQVGISQEDLAHQSGLSRSYLSGVERGVRNLALRNICILAKTLGLPPTKLLEFEMLPVAAGAVARTRRSGGPGVRGKKEAGGAGVARKRKP